MINPGNYRVKAVKGSAQLGETDKGNLQIAINLDVKDPKSPDGQWLSIGEMTTFLYFSGDAAPYSYERLKALGWKGNGPDDIDNLDGIEANEVDARVTQPESYKASDGSSKMGTSKIEILTGAGKVTLAKPLDANTFKARLRALGGGSGGGTASGTPAAGGGSGPPF